MQHPSPYQDLARGMQRLIDDTVALQQHSAIRLQILHALGNIMLDLAEADQRLELGKLNLVPKILNLADMVGAMQHSALDARYERETLPADPNIPQSIPQPAPQTVAQHARPPHRAPPGNFYHPAAAERQDYDLREVMHRVDAAPAAYPNNGRGY